MCGRFTLKTPAESLCRQFLLPTLATLPDMPAVNARYNIAPTQPVVTVLVMTGDREFRMMRWGLVPSWAKDPAIGSRLINARAETVAQKPAFRSCLKNRRCLVIADGFYEWRQTPAPRQAYHIAMKDGAAFAFAGLWDRRQEPGKPAMESCTIITTQANDVVAAFHERMPVILDPADYALWLDASVQDADKLLPLLRPHPAEKMVAWPVGPLVNSPTHESPDCLKEL